MLRITNLKLKLGEEEYLLRQRVLERFRIRDKSLLCYRIVRKAVDARKDEIRFVYTVDVELRQEKALLAKYHRSDVTTAPDQEYRFVTRGVEQLQHPPVVIGIGPAGLLSGLVLAQMGYRPLLLERGADVESRTELVQRFWSEGQLDPASNVQFGEGGAGTFSDGKLTTLIRDKRCRKVLQEFVKAGAPEEILYLNKPHVGTDHLKGVVKEIRGEIIRLGGEVRFYSQVTDLEIEDHRLAALIINGAERLPCGPVLLGIGHSARDTFAMLDRQGVNMTQKPFSIGVRIEHPQALINNAQYGRFAGDRRLGAADYKLVYHSPEGRSAYTFCNCPGGYVIAAASEQGGVVTNGMSLFARDGANANSALLVGVGPGDFGSDHPLAGIEFQRYWERLAFQLGGGDYRAPVQLLGDFLTDQASGCCGSVQTSYRPGVNLAELKHCLPDYVVATMKEAIPQFATRIEGFDLPDAVLTGVETRSSSPVRITRDASYCSSLTGLYPIGEGSGYAGGIISAAVDGIRGAEQVASRYAPLQ